MRGAPRRSGFSLVELVVVLAIATLAAALATPDVLRLSSGLRVRSAAAAVAGALRSARALAVREGANAAIRFRSDDDAVFYTLYKDGDEDGVSNADIDSGVDPPVGPAHRIRHLGSRIRFGFPPSDRPPRDPSDPRRVLTRLDDPIRFNRSNLASFNPLGGSTPGSVYLTDGLHHLTVVRLYGITGKVRTLSYDYARESWH